MYVLIFLLINLHSKNLFSESSMKYATMYYAMSVTNNDDFIGYIYSGYMAPEYAMLGQFSVKSDIFSFGVVVLEIVTGQKNNFRNGENREYLPSYVSFHTIQLVINNENFLTILI